MSKPSRTLPAPPLLAALAVATSWGCSGRPVGVTGDTETGTGTTGGETSTTGTDATATTGPDTTSTTGLPDLSVFEDPGADILFVVDNSGSMGEEQANIASAIGDLLAVLDRPDVDLDVRIGVTTTDNGNLACNGTTPEGGMLRATSCRSRPTEFVFNGTNPPTDKFDEACAAWCPNTLDDLATLPTTTEHDPQAKPRAWVERIDGVTNLPDGVSVEDALRCFLPQGINGCGFESQLESMWKALQLTEQSSAPNYDFRRTDAILAVVFVTDEADCSANPEFASIFDPNGNRVFWSDPGAIFPTSAVCWNAGVSCQGGPGTYSACNPVNKGADGSEGVPDDQAVLHPVSRYVDLLQSIESDQVSRVPWREVIVAGITGVPEGYAEPGDILYQDAADPQFQMDFGIGPGCVSPFGTAVPPVRLRDVAEAFRVPETPPLFSICSADYGPVFTAIGEAIAAQKGEGCVLSCVADTDPSTPGYVDPSCVVTERYTGPSGTEERILEPCVLTCGGSPCGIADGPDGWTFPAGADTCYRVLVDRTGQTPTDLDDMSDFCADQGWNLELEIERMPGTKPPDAVVDAMCEPSDNVSSDCPDLM